ncbi:MAG: kelch repeat-containing protein [Acidobacteriota bacterium]
MKNQRNHARHHVGLILILLGLISGVILMLEPDALAQAPAAAPSWSYTGSLNRGRREHTATLLPDGKVLVVGGRFFSCSPLCGGITLNSAELYDSATGVWSNTGSLNQPRLFHQAILLANGQVLVAGGIHHSGTNILTRLSSAELYDPATGKWRPTGSFNRIQGFNQATRLPNGRVLAVGYILDDRNIVAELYDPATGTWSNIASPGISGITIALPNGKILITDGHSAESYDPATEQWSIASASSSNAPFYDLHTATLLHNGKILAYGYDYEDPGPTSAILFDPATGTWSRTADLHPFDYETATLLPSGKVLLTGGKDCSNPVCTGQQASELYDPTTGTWTLTSQLNTGRTGYTAVLLQNGKVLVAAGAGDFDSSAELYNPATSPTDNQIDDTQFFVRQHYLDFLSREPDPDGLAFWSNEIASCGGDARCIQVKRINVSAAYFLSIEFQQTGYLVYRMYKAAYGNLPNAPVPIKFSEFLPDTRQIGQAVIVNQAGWETVLENNKRAFAAEFVQRSRFTSDYPTSFTPDQFVDQLFMNAGMTPAANDRAAAINEFGSATTTSDVAARMRTLRRVAESSTLAQQEFNKAFVLMQYFGYLRRNPNDAPEPGLNYAGYNFWLNKLNNFNGDFVQAEMVKAFINSTEYRQRFDQQ